MWDLELKGPVVEPTVNHSCQSTLTQQTSNCTLIIGSECRDGDYNHLNTVLNDWVSLSRGKLMVFNRRQLRYFPLLYSGFSFELWWLMIFWSRLFSQASGVVLRIVMTYISLFTLKYPNKYWMDCHNIFSDITYFTYLVDKTWKRCSWFSEDEP